MRVLPGSGATSISITRVQATLKSLPAEPALLANRKRQRPEKHASTRRPTLGNVHRRQLAPLAAASRRRRLGSRCATSVATKRKTLRRNAKPCEQTLNLAKK